MKKDHLEPRATRGRGDSLLARHARERGARRSQQYTLHVMFSILSSSVFFCLCLSSVKMRRYCLWSTIFAFQFQHLSL